MNRPSVILSVALVAFSSSVSLANNTFFLPGDAYFYARLDLKEARALGDVESPVLGYGNHWDGGVGCGFIGYQKVQLTKMSAETKGAIVDAYRLLEKGIEKDADSSRKMSVFVYAGEYDWKRFGLGLQYNEDWVADSVAFGAVRDHVRLESFVSGLGIERNWRDSTQVDRLPAVCPTLPEGREQFAWTKTPVAVDMRKCKLVIIPNRDFDSYLQPADGLEVIAISGGKLVRFRRIEGEWEREGS